MTHDDLAKVLFNLCVVVPDRDRPSHLDGRLARMSLSEEDRNVLRARVITQLHEHPYQEKGSNAFWLSARVMGHLAEAGKIIAVLGEKLAGDNLNDLAHASDAVSSAQFQIQTIQHRLGPPPDESADTSPLGPIHTSPLPK